MRLPPSISKLTAVKRLVLYGSNLVSLPPEIANMSSLEYFDIYTSRRLHWLPYEVTRCQRLVRSRASTRQLYGNNKTRGPFPKLPQVTIAAPSHCSVCTGFLKLGQTLQAWISLLVATDVFPLLVFACSTECLRRLPGPSPSIPTGMVKAGVDTSAIPDYLTRHAPTG